MKKKAYSANCIVRMGTLECVGLTSINGHLNGVIASQNLSLGAKEKCVANNYGNTYMLHANHGRFNIGVKMATQKKEGSNGVMDH